MPTVCAAVPTYLFLQGCVMSERGSNKHDSPRRSSSKESDKSGSMELCSKLLVEKEESTIVTHAHTAQPVFSPSKLAPAAVVCEPSTSDKLDIFEAVIKWFY